MVSRFDQRGQAATLEAIVAALILLSSVVFALQMTAVTPLSASTSSQHIENQLEASAEGLLATAVEDGSLKRALLFYNNSTNVFVGADNDGYNARPPNNTFGETLSWAFDDRGIAYNIYVEYSGSNTGRNLYYRGEPSDNAVAATTTLVVMDETPMYHHADDDGVLEPRSYTVSQALPNSSYIPDASPGTLYNIVRVEVVVWRI